MINMKLTKMILLLFITVLCSMGIQLRAERSIPLYNDGFDNAAFLAENYKPSPVDAWHVKDGWLVVTPTGTASVVLKQSVPMNCEVVMDITPLDVKKEFAGIILHGISFLICPDAYWYPYRVEGIDKYLGGRIKADINENQKYSFRVVSRKVNEAMMFSWFVNDVKVAEFIEAGKIDIGSFAFLANKMPAMYDNLAITSLAQGDVSANLLFNSSFELDQDDYPLNWNMGDPTYTLGVYDTIDPFWQAWGLEQDKANVRSGTDKSPIIQFFENEKPITEKKRVVFNKDNSVEFSLPCNMKITKSNTALVGKIFSSKGTLLKRVEQVVKLEKCIDAYTQRNYYMNENNAILVSNINIPLQPSMTGTVKVTDKDGKPFLVIAPLFHMFSPPQIFMQRVVHHWSTAGFKTMMIVMNSTRKDYQECIKDMFIK